MNVMRALRADPGARALAIRFIDSTILCRSESANADLRHVFERLIREEPCDSSALAVLRRLWLERWRPSPSQFRDYYNDCYLPERLREIRCLVATRPASYIDVGCGDGRVTAALTRSWGHEHCHTVGVEIATTIAQAGRDFVRLMVPDDHRWHLPVPSASVDLVTVFHVLHHSPVPLAAVLREIRRVIRPDGWLVVREHDVTTASERLFLQFTEMLFAVVLFGQAEERPCQHRSAEEWIDMLASAGFRTERAVRFHKRRHNLDVDLLCSQGISSSTCDRSAMVPSALRA